ncbi:MAG: WD40 repeat domain-containing protein, partial [bacterium]
LNYFRFFVNYTGKIREYVNTVWERKLEANLSMKPAVVLNHNNNEKEIFVQDERNYIYLVNNNGGIVWKMEVDGQILGMVHQLDYYGNGKLQYLFNTENKIYLIDRNGNSVEKFPVNLREKASAGLALFDYDNNSDFRIPVPTIDRDIMMYDKEGNIVSGWRFRKADKQISFPLEHYRIGNKDYIVAKDDFNLYILDRRGKIRVKPSEQIDFSHNNPVFFLPAGAGKERRLIASDRKGDVYAFYFNGTVEKIMEQQMSEDHYFMPADINGNGITEFIYLDSSRLEVYNHSSQLMFSEIYPGKIDLPPALYSFSPVDKKIGIVARESERIYLVNNDGSLYKGFPLQGASLFSISSFPGLRDRFNLLVGNNDNFLYNYSVK